MEGLRERVRNAGLGELHLNAVVWGIETLPTENTLTEPKEILKYLGIDSATSYVWVHHIPFTHFPDTSYSELREICKKEHERLHREYDMPYYPNVTMGWDSTPRTVQTDVFEELGYPYYPVYTGNTPDEFKKALLDMKTYLDTVPQGCKMGTINAWNEWTEGSYLEPDTVHGMAYLKAIKEVFGEE